MKSLVFVACLILGLAASGGMSSWRDFQAHPESRGMDAHTLWQVFQDNRNGAEKLYAERNITVEGYVVESGTSNQMPLNVKLSNTQNGQVYVNCILPGLDAAGKPAKLVAGQKVVITGHGASVADNVVIIKDCKELK